jgi:hypothetical protein
LIALRLSALLVAVVELEGVVVQPARAMLPAASAAPVLNMKFLLCI